MITLQCALFRVHKNTGSSVPYSYHRIPTGFLIIRFCFLGGGGNVGYDFVDYDTI
jgi:hypothetical protein